MDLTGLSGSANSYAADTYTSIKKDEAKLNGFKQAFESAENFGTDKELMEACQEFEAYFLQTMYKAMRKTVDTSGSFVPKSQAQEIFEEMLDEETCKTTARTGSFGLANFLYKQMSREKKADEDMESISTNNLPM